MRHVIVDGYNVVHAWPRLKRVLLERGLEDARAALVQQLGEYAAHSGVRVTVVFDAHSRDRRQEGLSAAAGVTVLYGSRQESADHVIERLANEAARRDEAIALVVVTSDRLQRAMVGAMGVPTMGAVAFADELRRVHDEVGATIRQQQEGAASAQRVEGHLPPDVLRRLEDLRRGSAVSDEGAEDV